MRQVAYTNHIGHSSRDKHSGKSTAIMSLADLAATEKHNNHDYTQDEVDRMQSSIDLEQRQHNHQYAMRDGCLTEITGHLDLEEEVRRVYQEQFSAAVAVYNEGQVAKGHPGRQISSYIDKVSDAKQQEVAVEGLIQFGSLEDWEGMSMADRERAVPLLLHGLKLTMEQLRQDGAEFVLAGVSIHLNEGTPHLHYVGVPVQHVPDAKGLTDRVKKSAVFTKETLGTGLQDNVRAAIEPELTAAYGWTFEAKEQGRNRDLTKNQIANRKLRAENEKRRLEALEAQQRLNSINQAIYVAQNDLAGRIQQFGQQSIQEALSNPEGIYDNILFLVAECDDERFDALDREGRELREEYLQDTLSQSINPLQMGLEQSIAAINAGKPARMFWEQRKELWGEYGQMSQDFWEMRRFLHDQYYAEKNDAYKRRSDAMHTFYECQYLIRRSRSIIFMLIMTVCSVAALERAKGYERKIKEVNDRRAKLVKGTARFSEFSRDYRADLKAGRFPGDDLLAAMASIVEDLDREHQVFQEQDLRRKPGKGHGLSR